MSPSPVSPNSIAQVQLHRFPDIWKRDDHYHISRSKVLVLHAYMIWKTHTRKNNSMNDFGLGGSGKGGNRQDDVTGTVLATAATTHRLVTYLGLALCR